MDNRLAECQRVVGYHFANPELLEIALRHSSLRTPDLECNERLEFLGDSVLGLVITEELYKLLPDQAEGELTRIKSSVVARGALYRASQTLGLARFAQFARGVGRNELPVSVTANLVEAVIGAIYLDAGFFPAREFVINHMGHEIDDILNDRGAKNYKSILQHDVQQGAGVTPTYRTVDEDGPDHRKGFMVAALIRGKEWGRATGPTKKDAEQEAARLALEAWQRRGSGRRRRSRGPDSRSADSRGPDSRSTGFHGEGAPPDGRRESAPREAPPWRETSSAEAARTSDWEEPQAEGFDAAAPASPPYAPPSQPSPSYHSGPAPVSRQAGRPEDRGPPPVERPAPEAEGEAPPRPPREGEGGGRGEWREDADRGRRPRGRGRGRGGRDRGPYDDAPPRPQPEAAPEAPQPRYNFDPDRGEATGVAVPTPRPVEPPARPPPPPRPPAARPPPVAPASSPGFAEGIGEIPLAAEPPPAPPRAKPAEPAKRVEPRRKAPPTPAEPPPDAGFDIGL